MSGRQNSTVIVSPSLLAADVLHFADEIDAVQKAGADWLHVDVMDGHFVPNLSYGLPMVRAFKSYSSLPLDVHIMVSNPDEVAPSYVEAGADYLSFPVESATHAHRLCQRIRDAGAKSGVAINPGTSLELLWPLLGEVDLINIMSVNPGFGGQSFLPAACCRIAEVKQRLEDYDMADKIKIEVDGGINAETAKQVRDAGANVLVAGNFVFSSKNYEQSIQALRSK